MRRVVLPALLCLAAAGCGGTERETSAPAPRMPARVAGLLAEQSRALAASLERGDACAAQLRLGELRASAESAVVTGAVPRVFRPHLRRAVSDLASRTPPCVLNPPGDKGEGNRGEGHGKGGKGKSKGRD